MVNHHTYQAILNKENDILIEKARAVQIARDEALEEGRAEGRVEGRAEGREEAKIETARKMLSDGLSIELIAKYSGLSIEELQKLG